MKASDFFRDADGNWHRKPRYVNLTGPNTFAVDATGGSLYQANLSAICGGHTYDGHRLQKVATLIHEDRNRFDSLVVRIDVAGKTVGYLPRESAKQFISEMDRHGYSAIPARCDSLIVGGWDRYGERGNFGVKLDLPWASEHKRNAVDGPTAKAICMLTSIERLFEQFKTYVDDNGLQNQDAIYERLDQLRIEVDSYTEDEFLDEWD